MKLSSITFLLIILQCFNQIIAEVGDEMNPEDVDDVKPPVEEEQNEQVKDLPGEGGLKKTTLPSLELLKSATNETKVKDPAVEKSAVEDQNAPAQNEKYTPIKVEPVLTEKKDELLTGKEETIPPKTEAVPDLTTLLPETTVPSIGEAAAEVNPEDSNHEKEVVVGQLINKEEAVDKENAAPEFEAKQEVEGGKGEEDPDANVDKPAQVDPPKDEADGAAKEDRETPAIGAEGLHEAVEEARGNPAPAAPVPEKKKDSADDEQTLDTEPAIRPLRVETERNFNSKYERYSGGNDDSTGFMSFFFIASFLVVFIYILQHNKKKILGLMFEGRSGRSSSGSRRGGNVKYRRLSQNESS